MRCIHVLMLAAVIVIANASPANALGQWPNAPYAYPTDSWVGDWLYGTNGNHTGADLWGTQSGAGSQGPAVHAAYQGYVANLWWLCEQSGGVFITRNYDCRSDPGVLRSTKYGVTIVGDDGIVTHYWHMADQATFSSWVQWDLFVDHWVPQGKLLGYQGNATGVAFTLLHLQFTVGYNYTQDSFAYAFDPTPYVGPNLRDGSPYQGRRAWFAYNGP